MKFYSKTILLIFISAIFLSCASTEPTKSAKSGSEVAMNKGQKKVQPKAEPLAKKLMHFKFNANIDKMDCKKYGKIKVFFVVTEEARIENPEISQSLSPNCDRAALDAVMLLKFKTPGLLDGKPVRVGFTQPFTIQQ